MVSGPAAAARRDERLVLFYVFLVALNLSVGVYGVLYPWSPDAEGRALATLNLAMAVVILYLVARMRRRLRRLRADVTIPSTEVSPARIGGLDSSSTGAFSPSSP